MKDLNVLSPEFFYGCKTKPRTIIQKKKIPDTDYVYANLKKNEWNITTEECKKAQLLVSKEWIDRNFFPTIKKQKTEETNEINEPMKDDEQFNENKDEIEISVIDEECENAPPELFLEDEEKFKDINGNIIEIETIGEKHEDKIFFKLKDVMEKFDIKNLHSHIIDKKSGYKFNTDYKYFFNRVYSKKDDKCTVKKVLYLTYRGLSRVITTSRRHIHFEITNWLNNLLGVQFVHHRFISAETDTIECIISSLCCETIKQYIIDRYRVDLYIPKYNIVVECDENEHKDRDVEYETERELYITNKLNCIFIRYDPYSEYFNIFKVINDINKEINKIEEKKVQELQNEIKIINLNKELEIQKLTNEKEMLKVSSEMLKKELENNHKIHELEKKTLELELKLLKCNV
jgi:very-short-patch-repair endonuclease